MGQSKNILIVTGKDGFLGQRRKPWDSLDMATINNILADSGYSGELIDYATLANAQSLPKNKTIIYSFHQTPEIRNYVKDLAVILNQRGNFLIPSLEMLFCHENKGFQELYKKDRGFKSLDATYYPSSAWLNPNDVDWPVVLKKVSGASGSSVFLVHSLAQFKKHYTQLAGRLSFGKKIGLFRRRYFRKKKVLPYYRKYSNLADFKLYRKYIQPARRFVLQQFVPGLSSDFRVLAGGDRFYVMKRHVRKNDFRASGSKKFDFNVGQVGRLLDYAREVKETLGGPFLSMDFCEINGGYGLIEFQGMHFGTSVITQSTGWYQALDSEWQFVEENPDLEGFFANGLVDYLDKHFAKAV